MTKERLLQGLALLTAILYSSLAWVWFVELMPGTGGLQPFDTRFFGYTAAEGQAFVDALSHETRQVYLNDIRVLDTVFPISLAALFVALMFHFGHGAWRALAILPLAYLAADLLENARVAAILLQDAPDPQSIDRASQATVAKFGFLIVSVIALGALFVTTKRP